MSDDYDVHEFQEEVDELHRELMVQANGKEVSVVFTAAAFMILDVFRVCDSPMTVLDFAFRLKEMAEETIEKHKVKVN